MATDIELGARTFPGETAVSLLVQTSPPNQNPGGDEVPQRIGSPQQGNRVLEMFLQNLMAALGAWHV